MSKIPPFRAVAQGRELDPKRGLVSELERVSDQVQEHAAQLPSVTVDLRQLADDERRPGALKPRAEIGADLADHRLQRDALGAQLARLRVGEDPVDQVACPPGA